MTGDYFNGFWFEPGHPVLSGSVRKTVRRAFPFEAEHVAEGQTWRQWSYPRREHVSYTTGEVRPRVYSLTSNPLLASFSSDDIELETWRAASVAMLAKAIPDPSMAEGMVEVVPLDGAISEWQENCGAMECVVLYEDHLGDAWYYGPGYGPAGTRSLDEAYVGTEREMQGLMFESFVRLHSLGRRQGHALVLRGLDLERARRSSIMN